MNKILLVLCLVCLPGFASAQKTVGWCDEIEMLGTWEVTSYAGDFKSLPYDYRELTPVSVTFSLMAVTLHSTMTAKRSYSKGIGSLRPKLIIAFFI